MSIFVASGILCQGRGSCKLGCVLLPGHHGAVDAVRHNAERFLPDARSGPPDIDIEACSVRRLSGHIYDSYGRDRAHQVKVITYRPRSAMRRGAGAGIPGGQRRRGRVGKGGSARLLHAARLCRLPRHIHPFGRQWCPPTSRSRICPVGWAAMEGRTVLQWDKEDVWSRLFLGGAHGAARRL